MSPCIRAPEIPEVFFKRVLAVLRNACEGSMQVALQCHADGRRVDADYRNPSWTETRLGRGVNGPVVLLGGRGAACKERFALKVLDLAEALQLGCQQQLVVEIRALLAMDHPCVVRVTDVYAFHGRVWIVMEKLHETLLKRVQECGPLSERQAAQAVDQIARALRHIHEKGFAHGDVKLENCLYADTSHRVLKLCDFGLARQLEDEFVASNVGGTLMYAAPEIVNRKSGATQETDIYSLGVVLYAALTGTMPFEGERRQVIERIRRGSYRPLVGDRWDDVSSKAKQLVRALLSKDPSQRPTLEAVLSHTWVAQARQGDDPVGDAEEEARLVKGFRWFTTEATQEQRTCQRVLVASRTGAERGAADALFLRVDASGRGFVTAKDLDAYLSPQLPTDDVSLIFKALDSDGLGRVSCSEFAAAALSMRPPSIVCATRTLTRLAAAGAAADSAAVDYGGANVPPVLRGNSNRSLDCVSDPVSRPRFEVSPRSCISSNSCGSSCFGGSQAVWSLIDRHVPTLEAFLGAANPVDKGVMTREDWLRFLGCVDGGPRRWPFRSR